MQNSTFRKRFNFIDLWKLTVFIFAKKEAFWILYCVFQFLHFPFFFINVDSARKILSLT